MEENKVEEEKVYGLTLTEFKLRWTRYAPCIAWAKQNFRAAPFASVPMKIGSGEEVLRVIFVISEEAVKEFCRETGRHYKTFSKEISTVVEGKRQLFFTEDSWIPESALKITE